MRRMKAAPAYATLGYVGLRPRSGYAPFDMGDLRVLATRALAGGFAVASQPSLRKATPFFGALLGVHKYAFVPHEA